MIFRAVFGLLMSEKSTEDGRKDVRIRFSLYNYQSLDLRKSRAPQASYTLLSSSILLVPKSRFVKITTRSLPGNASSSMGFWDDNGMR